MRRVALVLLSAACGAALGACGGGGHGTRSPHLPPPAPSTGTTGIIQGHETTTRATTTSG